MPQRESGLHVPGETVALIEVYQHEILQIEKIYDAINAHQGQRRSVQGFVDEVVERFAEIGILAEVITFEDENEPGFFGFNVVLRERIDPRPFDHARMAWEVQHDLVELDGAGAITKDGTWIEPSKSTSMTPRTPPAPTKRTTAKKATG